jgi:hypothetical protein
MPCLKQLFYSNNRNRFHWVVLDLSQDDFDKTLGEYSLKRDLLINTNFNPPLFSLANNFNNFRATYSEKSWLTGLFLLLLYLSRIL